jgi:IS30 family transposase
LTAALERLAPRDRLRLGCYYAQQLTLAEVGRVLGEHEATVSRRLSRTRTELKKVVEHVLRAELHLGEAAVANALEHVVHDAGPIDLEEILSSGERKKAAPSRSKSR